MQEVPDLSRPLILSPRRRTLGPAAGLADWTPQRATHPPLWPCGSRSGGPISTFPRGGACIKGAEAANLSDQGWAVRRVTWFEVVCQAVVVNGQPIRPDRQLHGTAGDDLAIPAAGDDAIVYTSGALVIADTPPDCGRDHAALGRHDTRNLTFQPGGPDLLVGPPTDPSGSRTSWPPRPVSWSAVGWATRRSRSGSTQP